MKKVRFNENVEVRYYELSEKEIIYKKISLDLYLKLEDLRRKLKKINEINKKRREERHKLKKINEINKKRREENENTYLPNFTYLLNTFYNFFNNFR